VVASSLAAAALALAWRRGSGAAAPALLDPDESRRPRGQRPAALPSPDTLRHRLAALRPIRQFVNASRAAAAAVLRSEDDRLLAIVGPCSIHDLTAARDYAARLRAVAAEHRADLFVMMRVYLEKPRTAVGWRGLVSDPDLSGREDVARGVELGRRVMLDVNAAGLPVATEFLDPLVAPFFEDLVAYGSIGARTVESPTHRALAAHLAMPIGFKNARSGDIQSAVNAAVAAAAPQRRLAPDGRGRVQISQAPGNPHGHVVLRGGEDGPNFGNASVAEAVQRLGKAGIAGARVVVDCSHANSGKRHEGQVEACESVAAQVAGGASGLGGVMVESFLQAGNQPLDPGVTKPSDLRYGVSVTDECMDFGATEALLRRLAGAVRERRERNVVVGWASASTAEAAPGAARSHAAA